MLEQLRGKKIAILGLGVNNVQLANYLRNNGVEFEVVQKWAHPDELIGRLTKFDVVFRTPGLPYLSAAIQEAKQAGVAISSQTKLFFSICPARIIGVTGTKGKGTTSSLIAKILETAGKKVWLGGNIGKDPFEFIAQIKPDDLVVLELSSFQLQDLEQSPQLAVVLSISPDHLNHHADMDEYVKAKSNIVAFQTDGDYAVVDRNLPDWFLGLGKGKKVFIDPQAVVGWATKLLGRHNLENIAAAAAAAEILGVDEQVIKQAVSEFEPLPHRLEVVSIKNGITFVDDSISTNEDSTIAAIKSFTQPMIIILGGRGKGLDYSNLGSVIRSTPNVKAVVITGEDAPLILEATRGFKGKIASGGSMQEIFQQAVSLANSGDVVLLSPAAASFDMFSDYKDRGDQFRKEVERL